MPSFGRAPRLPTSARSQFDPLAFAFPAQASCILDPSTFVAVTCSGRAGKTTGAALKWHQVRREKPGQMSYFIALTRDHAKAILWQELKRQNEAWLLGLKFSESELSVTDSNGSTLRLLGANRDDLIDVLRGIPFVLVIFDEAAFMRRGLLERCVDDAIHIRLLDLAGQCWVMSTPGLVKGGWFYKVSTGKQPGWSRHHWTLLDNPHIPKYVQDPTERERVKLKWIRDQQVAKGWTDTSPSFMRGFLGLWAEDPDAQVYPISAYNEIPTMPLLWTSHRHEWISTLGVDYGVVNATAHALCAFHPSSNAVYVVRSRRDVGMGTTDANQITQRWIADENPSFVVGDAGGLGKAFVVEAQQRFGMAIEPAEKLGKRGHQEYVADALRARPPRLFVITPTNEDLVIEMEQLAWEPFPSDDPRYRQKEDPRGRKDLCDAMLYSYMKCFAHFPTVETPPPANPEDYPDRNRDWTRYTH